MKSGKRREATSPRRRTDGSEAADGRSRGTAADPNGTCRRKAGSRTRTRHRGAAARPGSPPSVGPLGGTRTPPTQRPVCVSVSTAAADRNSRENSCGHTAVACPSLRLLLSNKGTTLHVEGPEDHDAQRRRRPQRERTLGGRPSPPAGGHSLGDGVTLPSLWGSWHNL